MLEQEGDLTDRLLWNLLTWAVLGGRVSGSPNKSHDPDWVHSKQSDWALIKALTTYTLLGFRISVDYWVAPTSLLFSGKVYSSLLGSLWWVGCVEGKYSVFLVHRSSVKQKVYLLNFMQEAGPTLRLDLEDIIPREHMHACSVMSDSLWPHGL